MKVRKIRYRSGVTAWQVDLGMVTQDDGKKRRVQKYFETKDAAFAVLGEAKGKRARHGDAAIAFSEEDRIRFSSARDQLATVGATIEQAVAHFLRHARALQQPVSLADLLARCLADKERLGKSPRYLQQLKCSCLNFIRGREERLAHTVTRDEVGTWVLGQGWMPKTQRVYLGDLRALFAWAVAKRFVPENPASGDGAERIELASMGDTPIARLGTADVKRLLRWAARRPARGREDFRALLWYAVLGIFCGVRPKELERLDRGAVDLHERHVVIEGHQAKTRRRRVVDLTKEAVRWLALDERRMGPVCPVNFIRRWRRLRAAAGLLPWAHDVMRHTFASMHYAEHQNEGLLKAQMGHSDDEDTLMQHYRALVKRKEAREFWRCAPSRRREPIKTI